MPALWGSTAAYRHAARSRRHPETARAPGLTRSEPSPGTVREYPDARWFETARAGLVQTKCDVMAEASGTNPRESEPALSHIRQALHAGTHVITSSKGACAAAGLELLALARQHGVECRMESTVMSGTPVLSTIRDGLAGARPLRCAGS